jgi:putative transposase
MYRRKNSLRLKNYNYKSAGIYSITMCVNQRLCLFGNVENKKLKLNDAGKMIARIFVGLSNYYEGLISDVYAVMPDHFHGILIINRPVRAGLRARPDERRKIFIPHKKGFMSRDNFKFYHYNDDNQ